MPTHLGKGILLAPTIHGNLIIGPDASDLSDMTAGQAAIEGLDTHEDRLLNIWEQGNELLPGMPATKIIRDFAGVRAASVGGDFIIGRDPDRKVSGYYQAVGIQSPGLTAAPAIADFLITEMAEDGLVLELDPDFDPRRPAYVQSLASARNSSVANTRAPLAPAELEARLKLEPGAEGRMICRCEQVPETAVVASLHQGINVFTVDAVKRRSRAGMGRCQGAYCRSRVLDVIVREQVSDQTIPDALTDIERKGVNRAGAVRLKKIIREREAKQSVKDSNASG